MTERKNEGEGWGEGWGGREGGRTHQSRPARRSTRGTNTSTTSESGITPAIIAMDLTACTRGRGNQPNTPVSHLQHTMADTHNERRRQPLTQTHRVPHSHLLHGGQRLQRRQQGLAERRSTHVWHKLSCTAQHHSEGRTRAHAKTGVGTWLLTAFWVRHAPFPSSAPIVHANMRQYP